MNVDLLSSADLRQPNRQPRLNPFAHGIRHYDYEEVEQSNGLLAQFTWDSSKPEEGWQFNCWRDQQRFILLQGNAQVGEFAQLLLDSTPEKNAAREEERRKKEQERRAKLPKETPEQEVGRWKKFMVPVMTRVQDAPVLSDLVSVQPMARPSTHFTPLQAVFTGELRGKPPRPVCGPDEELHQYVYGGVSAERGGWFVTSKSDPGRVLRYRMDWLS